MVLKDKLTDYTESEFLEFVKEIFEPKSDLKGAAFEKYHDGLVDHFSKITEHPSASDVLFYPVRAEDDSPAGVVKAIKEWLSTNGKSGFKMV